MQNKELLHFTFIANFRGGTYCTQVQAADVYKSIPEWIRKIKKEQDQIQYLGNKIIEELKKEAKDENNEPVLLNGLQNVWFISYSTTKGSFHINIVQTDPTGTDLTT